MRSNVEYIRVYSEYESDDMPVIYLYEVDMDHERLAVRVVEIFANRQVKKIDNLYCGVIEIVPIPTVKDFHSKVWGDGFCAAIIAQEEFEKTWSSSSYSGALSVE